MSPPQKPSDDTVFHAIDRGSNVGRTHCEECGTQLVNPDRLSPGFIGQSRCLVPRRILRTCRENNAYNTLPYNFPRMLRLPLLERWPRRLARRAFPKAMRGINRSHLPK